MNLKRRNYNSGVALVFAISVATVFIVMGFLLFALARSNFFIQKSQNQILQKKIHMQQVFKGDVISGSQFFYNENTIPSGSGVAEVKTFNNIQYSVKITNSDSSSGSISFMMPESGYTMRTRDYYVTMGLDNSEKNIVIKVPSTTQPSLDSGIDKSVISLNIPAIDFNELSGIQLNGNQDITDKEVGYIGSLKVDSNNQELIFTNKNNEESSPLKLSGFESGTLSLSQGWELKDGLWNLSIGIFNPDTNEGCVITTSLQNFLSNFTGLECINLNKEDEEEDIQGARYPNPAGFPICVEGERHGSGYICHEDGILFIANKNNADSLPFQNSGDWRVYYPSSDWVAPYTQGARYSDGDLVVYDGMIFRSTQNNQNRDPFSDKDWRINGVYAWSDKVRYLSGDIVIYQNEFYQARRTNEGNSDSPTDDKDWTKVGSTLGQTNIDQLPQQAQANIRVGTTVNDYKPANIVFPYREKNPSQTQLNCEGEYPPIDTTIYKQCIDGEVYDTGDMCYENNMLFEAQWYIKESPFNKPDAWRPYIPNIDWVLPYSNNVEYGNKTVKVIYDNKRFINKWWVDYGETPYEDDVWRIDGIYEWHKDIQYLRDDIVIRDGNFYRANYDSDNKDPLSNARNSWDEWINLGVTYNGQTVQEVLNSCSTLNNSNAVIEFTLGDNLFSDGTGNYITTNIPTLPSSFGLYGDANPTAVSYTLSGSLFDAISLIYVTDANGWVPLYNPSAQGETLVRDWGSDNATIFINTNYGSIPSGNYDLNIEMEYSLNGQTYRGSHSYSVRI